MRVRLTIDGQHATATLADNPTARDFASLLPITVPMRDLFDREKPGPLTRALDDGGEHEFRYEIGQLAYWPPEHEIAIFYAEAGPSIPSPGIIPLGTIDAGLDTITGASDEFAMTIEATSGQPYPAS
ncbi:MAG: cyclophilin-like fold protein [Solirubrobacteraceae bacterium]